MSGCASMSPRDKQRLANAQAGLQAARVAAPDGPVRELVAGAESYLAAAVKGEDMPSPEIAAVDLLADPALARRYAVAGKREEDESEYDGNAWGDAGDWLGWGAAALDVALMIFLGRQLNISSRLKGALGGAVKVGEYLKGYARSPEVVPEPERKAMQAALVGEHGPVIEEVRRELGLTTPPIPPRPSV